MYSWDATHPWFNGNAEAAVEPAISLFVTCDSQAEVDEFWAKFLDGGGIPHACGWLDDGFGLTWQIVPTTLIELMSDPDPKASGQPVRPR